MLQSIYLIDAMLCQTKQPCNPVQCIRHVVYYATLYSASGTWSIRQPYRIWLARGKQAWTMIQRSPWTWWSETIFVNLKQIKFTLWQETIGAHIPLPLQHMLASAQHPAAWTASCMRWFLMASSTKSAASGWCLNEASWRPVRQKKKKMRRRKTTWAFLEPMLNYSIDHTVALEFIMTCTSDAKTCNTSRMNDRQAIWR